jgi:hypothetical protein
MEWPLVPDYQCVRIVRGTPPRQGMGALHACISAESVRDVIAPRLPAAPPPAPIVRTGPDPQDIQFPTPPRAGGPQQPTDARRVEIER